MLVKVTFNSCSVCADGKYKLNYTLGEITQSIPDTVGIFCYDLLKNPLFAYALGYKFYEVEGIGEPRKKVPWCCLPNDYLESFYNNKTHYHNPISIPYTVLFDVVKPIRVIPKDELEFIYWKGGI